MPEERDAHESEGKAELCKADAGTLPRCPSSEGLAADEHHRQLPRPQHELPSWLMRGEAMREEGEARVKSVGREPRPLVVFDATRVLDIVVPEERGGSEEEGDCKKVPGSSGDISDVPR